MIHYYYTLFFYIITRHSAVSLDSSAVMSVNKTDWHCNSRWRSYDYTSWLMHESRFCCKDSLSLNNN